MTPAKIDPDAIAEYAARLEEMGDEYDLLKKVIAKADKRKKEINKDVQEICDNVGGKDVRVVLPMENISKAFDRRISNRGGGLDEALLLDVIGKRRFNNISELVETRVLDATKLETARMAGRITDEEIKQATRAPKKTGALYLMDLDKVEDDDDLSDL